ncbi:ABC transporter ATP-binding protein [Archaeoglobus neptunius]|uniref:ABC transporter ATP-binding protein n=1 Tax=Archaeoglobus neptunius TaxID=2798580 RepID=UPI0019280D7D
MIEVSNLTVKYGKVIAVNRVDFTIGRGEVVAILGPNGAGKSSIMKSLVGIVDYDGDIRFDGVDARTKEAKNLFGYVPEEVNLIDHLTPEELFNFIISVRELENVEKRVENLVRIFRIEDYMTRPILSLSMGNRKKVAVIAALLHDPPYLLLDEPLNGLDVFSARVLKEVISKKAENGGVLLSTHILDVAEKLATRVVVINGGRKIAEGNIDEILAGKSLEEVFLEITGQYENLGKIIASI